MGFDWDVDMMTMLVICFQTRNAHETLVKKVQAQTKKKRWAVERNIKKFEEFTPLQKTEKG